MEEAKGPLAVEIEHAQIVGFAQVAHDGLEMSDIALLGRRQGHLISNELVDAFGPELSEETRIGKGSVRVRITSGPLPQRARQPS